MSQEDKSTTSENEVELAKFSKERFRYGLWAVGFGVAALVVAFAVTVLQIEGWDPDKGLALFGAMASPLVAIVTAYFGIQASQQVATKAQDQAADAQNQAGQARAEAAVAQEQAVIAQTDAARAQEEAVLAQAEAARAPEQILDRLESPVRSALANALLTEPPQTEVLGGPQAEATAAAETLDQRTAAAWDAIRRDVLRRTGG